MYIFNEILRWSTWTNGANLYFSVIKWDLYYGFIHKCVAFILAYLIMLIGGWAINHLVRKCFFFILINNLIDNSPSLAPLKKISRCISPLLPFLFNFLFSDIYHFNLLIKKDFIIPFLKFTIVYQVVTNTTPIDEVISYFSTTAEPLFSCYILLSWLLSAGCWQ